MKDTDRRTFLRTTAVGGAILAAGPALLACGGEEWDIGELEQAAQTEDDKKIFSKYFKVEIKGIYGDVPGVTEVDAGRVTIEPVEAKQGDNPEYRTYTYGSHEYEDFTMTLQTGPGMIKLQQWVDAAMKMGGQGDALRRDISIYQLARDKKTPLRTINCFGCFPVSFDAGSHSTASDIKTITLTCNIDRIEVA